MDFSSKCKKSPSGVFLERHRWFEINETEEENGEWDDADDSGSELFVSSCAVSFQLCRVCCWPNLPHFQTEDHLQVVLSGSC